MTLRELIEKLEVIDDDAGQEIVVAISMKETGKFLRPTLLVRVANGAPNLLPIHGDRDELGRGTGSKWLEIEIPLMGDYDAMDA